MAGLQKSGQHDYGPENKHIIHSSNGQETLKNHLFSCSVSQVANLLCVLPKSGARRAQNSASGGSEIGIRNSKLCI